MRLVSLSAFVLFSSEIYLGIGRGGMERLISYPFTVWMIAFGLYMTIVRVKAAQRTALVCYTKYKLVEEAIG